MNLGNTTGRAKKVKEPAPKKGIFNVNELHDWIVGGNIPDERVHLCTSFIKPVEFAPGKNRRIY